MKRQEQIKLGINHQFLDLRSCQDPAWHQETLGKLAVDPRFDALDFWIPAAEPYRSQEIKMLRDCDKYLNYNIGDRYGEKVAAFAATDSYEHRYALDFFKREIDMALAVGAQKIIIGSGPDQPADRPAAMAAFADFLREASSLLPREIVLNLEPTDRDLDKYFLCGPLDETTDLIRSLRAEGCQNLAILLDMGHIPILHETIAAAVVKTSDCLGHIHLGNCIVRDSTHPLFGDKHVPWGIEQGEYGEADVRVMLRELAAAGYFQAGTRPTVTFEMRPYEELGPVASADRFIAILDAAWDEIRP